MAVVAWDFWESKLTKQAGTLKNIFCFPLFPVRDADIKTGATAAILGHEVTLKMEF